MEREDDNALRKGLHHATLHIVLTGEARELAEDERMVRHDEVAALLGNKQAGDVVEVRVPAGLVKLRIESVQL